MADSSLSSSVLSETADDLHDMLRTSGTWDGLEWDLATGLADGEKTNHVISPDGTIGDEYRMLKQAEGVKAAAPQRDPYHGRLEEPRQAREPKRETFNVMVVGESGLGKTTLLESFFKSFKDDEATFDLFERKETQEYLETRQKLDETLSKRNLVERAMKVAVEKQQYAEAHKMQKDVSELTRQMESIADVLKHLAATDEKRRNELRTLRARTRTLRMDTKRAADQKQYSKASEFQRQGDILQEECEALQAELKQTRRRPESRAAADHMDEEFEDLSGRRVLCSSTVRVKKFDPFSISLGKHELQVSLVDTPGYGDAVNTAESFDVIADYVESTFESLLQAESSWSVRDVERLRLEDPLVHVCLYFIAPHRLKHIDVAFMRRIHKLVNVVPIIAKSDTMTTEEKEEFKIQVREALMREGVEVFTFDSAIIRRMEQQDKLEYKHPWAVIGSTDSHLDAGSTVYLRKYPWGNALSSEPAHSDLPALRNLLMWSGQWMDLKLSARVKFEQWRASRTLSKRSTSLAASSLRVVYGRTAPVLQRAKAALDGARSAAATACAEVGVPPRLAARALLVLLAACTVPPAGVFVARALAADESSLTGKLALAEAEVSQLRVEKGRVVEAYEAKISNLTQQLTAMAAEDEVLRLAASDNQTELAFKLQALEAKAVGLELSLEEAEAAAFSRAKADDGANDGTNDGANDGADGSSDMDEGKEPPRPAETATEAKATENREAAKEARSKEPREREGWGWLGGLFPMAAESLVGSAVNGSKAAGPALLSSMETLVNTTKHAPSAVLTKASRKAKGLAQDVTAAAGWMVDAVKQGFEPTP